MKNTKLLVVMNESRATMRALEYVAQVASRRRDFRICLAHALPSPPPELVEFRGEEKARLRAYKRRWISVVEMTEQRALDRANTVLCRCGVAEKAIEAQYCNLGDATRATQKILSLARLRKCDTWSSAGTRSHG